MGVDFNVFLKKLSDPSVDRVTIVALGDSITELTWHTRGRLNWTGLLHEALFEKYGRNRVFMINAGKCGDTAAAALPRLDRDVLRFSPDLVIVSFGMNDAVAGPEGLPAFGKATREIIRRCREAGAAVLLRTPNPVVSGLWPYMTQGLPAGDEMPGNFQGQYAETLIRIASETKCPIVDHYTLWMRAQFEEHLEQTNTRWLRMSDEVHPGWQGHLVFYREMAPLFGLPGKFPWEE